MIEAYFSALSKVIKKLEVFFTLFNLVKGKLNLEAPQLNSAPHDRGQHMKDKP